MKKVLLSIIASVAICSFMACSNGDYNANVSTATVNNSQNPLNLLDSAGFNWTGTDPFSCEINGVAYQGDSVNTTYNFSAGNDMITSVVGLKGFFLNFNSLYAGNVYYLGYQSYNNYGIYKDTVTSPTAQYFSYNGTVGQVLILRNDPLRMIGKFYFQGKTTNGTIVNISNGWFNIHK